METELKKAIIESIFKNEKVFQLPNTIIEKFSKYIYDEKGEYLIGGVAVTDFIKNAINLITHN